MIDDRKLILIVDDDLISRQIASLMVETLGYHPFSLKDGYDINFTCIFFKNVRAVLMDIMMPKLNGFDAAAKIRKTCLDQCCKECLPIIAVTALDEEKVVTENTTFDAYIQKPLSLKVLKNVFEKLNIKA